MHLNFKGLFKYLLRYFIIRPRKKIHFEADAPSFIDRSDFSLAKSK